LYVLDRFDVLMSKIIFKKWKNIIYMHFNMKNYLKNTRNHTVKHALKDPIRTVPYGVYQGKKSKKYGNYGTALNLIFEFPLYPFHLINHCRKIDNYKRRNFLFVYCDGFYWYNFLFLYLSINILKTILLIYIKRIITSK
jgi:hypothetical protein